MRARDIFEWAAVGMNIVERHPDRRVPAIDVRRVEIVVLMPVSFGRDPAGQAQMQHERLADQRLQLTHQGRVERKRPQLA